MPFSIINNTSVPVNNSDFTLVVFKTAYHYNPFVEIKQVGSSSYISILGDDSNPFSLIMIFH